MLIKQDLCYLKSLVYSLPTQEALPWPPGSPHTCLAQPLRLAANTLAASFVGACMSARALGIAIQSNPLVTILKCHKKAIVINSNCYDG